MNLACRHLARVRFLVAVLAILALVSTAGAQVTAQGSLRALFRPACSYHAVGDDFDIDVRLENAVELNGITVVIHFDPRVLQVNGTQIRGQGDFWQGRTVVDNQPNFNVVDNVAGVITYTAFLLGEGGVSGSGTLATIPFHGQAKGLSWLTFDASGTEADAGGGLTPVPVQLVPGLVGIGTRQLYLPLIQKPR